MFIIKRLFVVLLCLFPLWTFADDVCPAGYTKFIQLPDEYEYSIPSDYTQLEYIQSNGEQSIATGVVSKRNTVVELDVVNLEARNAAIIGSRWENTFSVFSVQSMNNVLQFYFGTFAVARFSVNTGSRNIIKVELGKITINHIEQQYTYVEPKVGDELFINNIYDGSRGGYNKFYRVTIWEGSVLVRNFIPVKRNSDFVLGMYDTVTNTFYENSGSGEFIAGPEGTYSPVAPDNATCVACSYNTYKPNAGNENCTACPTGTFSPIGSTALSDCVKILNIGNYVVYMPIGKHTDKALCMMTDDSKVYCADVYEKQ